MLAVGWGLVAAGAATTASSGAIARSAGAARIATGTAWSPAASMASARLRHTATRLENGKVLVAGGQNHATHLATAELYDPVRNVWSPASSLARARESHTATLLADGRVLVVGGNLGLAFASSAELYDPRTNSWSSAGDMSVGRVNHTATLLPDGRVLVVGGFTATRETATVDLYDPVRNAWSSAPPLQVPRTGHQATLLQTGRVLISGGHATGPVTRLATQLYDPLNDEWSLASAPMLQGRAYGLATLLPNGVVLVTGGWDSSLTDAGAFARTELYNPVSNAWSAGATMTSSRVDHTATLLADGQVLVTGGVGSGELEDTESYDPQSDTWTSAPGMIVGRGEHTATLLDDGDVLVAGGYGIVGPSSLATAERLSARKPLAIASRASAPVDLGGQVFDTAWLTGESNPTGTITFRAFPPDNPTCLGPPFLAQPVFTETVAISSDGTARSGSFTPRHAGTYRWVAEYSGDARNRAASGTCGERDAKVMVNRAAPTLAVAPSDDVAVGGKLRGTAVLGGRVFPWVRGYVDFRLYGPGDATCSGPAVFLSAWVAYNPDDPSVTSDPYTPLAPGAYRWKATFSGDPNNKPATSGCSAASVVTAARASAPPAVAVTPPAALRRPTTKLDLRLLVCRTLRVRRVGTARCATGRAHLARRIRRADRPWRTRR